MQLLAKGALGALVLAVAAFSATMGMAQDKVTLRMVGSFPIGPSPTAEIGNKFMESVNRLGEGKVEITYLGASDVVPTFDQPEALVNGVFDVWYGAPNYWAGVVPGGDVTELSPFKIADQGPGSEIYEFLVGLFTVDAAGQKQGGAKKRDSDDTGRLGHAGFSILKKHSGGFADRRPAA